MESSGQVLKASPRFTHHTLMGDTDGELDESATDESTRGEFGALDADRGDLAMGEQAPHVVSAPGRAEVHREEQGQDVIDDVDAVTAAMDDEIGSAGPLEELAHAGRLGGGQ